MQRKKKENKIKSMEFFKLLNDVKVQLSVSSIYIIKNWKIKY